MLRWCLQHKRDAMGNMHGKSMSNSTNDEY
jgi:hypothetical protein